ncbi:MAG: hypothetical protein HYS27_26225 [Deltaproteobacteria bacterium]|nr:hypothetical protein [Deltaproteobacteria bacterium]
MKRVGALVPGADAFALVAGELGMLSAARLFVNEAEAAGGHGAIGDLKAALGSAFPVLDAVAGRALADDPVRAPSITPVVEALAGCTRVLFVGLEVDCVEPVARALAAQVPSATVGVILDMNLPHDEARVRANLEAVGERGVSLVPLTSFQRFSGHKSALVTAIYGTDGFRAAVCSSWVRIFGPDARTQFRSLLGWNLLGAPLNEYPRWLSETSASDFTELISGRSNAEARV